MGRLGRDTTLKLSMMVKLVACYLRIVNRYECGGRSPLTDSRKMGGRSSLAGSRSVRSPCANGFWRQMSYRTPLPIQMITSPFW